LGGFALQTRFFNPTERGFLGAKSPTSSGMRIVINERLANQQSFDSSHSGVEGGTGNIFRISILPPPRAMWGSGLIPNGGVGPKPHEVAKYRSPPLRGRGVGEVAPGSASKPGAGPTLRSVGSRLPRPVTIAPPPYGNPRAFLQAKGTPSPRGRVSSPGLFSRSVPLPREGGGSGWVRPKARNFLRFFFCPLFFLSPGHPQRGGVPPTSPPGFKKKPEWKGRWRVDLTIFSSETTCVVKI